MSLKLQEKELRQAPAEQCLSGSMRRGIEILHLFWQLLVFLEFCSQT